MSIQYQAQVNSRSYSVVDDLPTGYQVLVSGLVKDEISGEPTSSAFSVQLDRADLQVWMKKRGWFCIAGYAERAFPNWPIGSYDVEFLVTAPGYRARSFHMTLPQTNSLDIPLRPLPIRVQGRVVDSASVVIPLANAQVVLVDDPHPPLPLTEHLLAFRTPLQFDHASGVTVRERSLAPLGAARELAEKTSAGSLTVTLDSRAGLASNDILRLGTAIQFEYTVIESVAPNPANLNQPGDVTLRGALHRSFPAATPVQKVALGASGASALLARSADAGDGLGIVNALLSVDTVEFADPDPDKVEFHTVGAVSDGDGYFHLDGIGRVRTLFLQASAGGHTLTLPYIIDFAQPVNRVDFRFTF